MLPMQLQMSHTSTLLWIPEFPLGMKYNSLRNWKDFLAANLKQIILFRLIIIVKNVRLPLQQGQGI